MGFRLLLLAACIVAIETKSFLILDDVTVSVGDKLVYNIGDEQFLADYRVYRVIERGHKSLPDWLEYLNNSSQLIGSPEVDDVRMYAIRVRAECRDPSTSRCQNRISRTFHINVVEPLTAAESRGRQVFPVHVGKVKHGKGRVKIGSELEMQPKYTNMIEPTKTVLHEANTSVIPTESNLHDKYNHVVSPTSPATDELLIVSLCKPNDISFFASLVLHVVHGLSTSEILILKHRMSTFTSKDINLISVTDGATVLRSLHNTSNKHILTAGPGNVIESLANSVELSWHVTCNDIDKMADMGKIIQHNVDVGRFTEELGYDIIAWFVYSDKPVPRRNKRSVHNRGKQTKTPSITPPTPSTVSDLEPSFSSLSVSSPVFVLSSDSVSVVFVSSSSYIIDKTTNLIQSTQSHTISKSSEYLTSQLPETHSILESTINPTPVSLSISYDTYTISAISSSISVNSTLDSSAVPLSYSFASSLPLTPSLGINTTSATEILFNYTSSVLSTNLFTKTSVSIINSSSLMFTSFLSPQSSSYKSYHSSTVLGLSSTDSLDIFPSSVVPSSFIFTSIKSTLNSVSDAVDRSSYFTVQASTVLSTSFSPTTLLLKTSTFSLFESPFTISKVILDSPSSATNMGDSSYLSFSKSISSVFGPNSVNFSSSNTSFLPSISSTVYSTILITSMIQSVVSKTTIINVSDVYSTFASNTFSSFSDLSPSFSVLKSSGISIIGTLFSFGSHSTNLTSLDLSTDMPTSLEIETSLLFSTSTFIKIIYSSLLSLTLTNVVSNSLNLLFSSKSILTESQYTVVTPSSSIFTTSSFSKYSFTYTLVSSSKSHNLSLDLSSPSKSIPLFLSSFSETVSIKSAYLSSSFVLPSFSSSISLDSDGVETKISVLSTSVTFVVIPSLLSTSYNIMFSSGDVSQHERSKSSIVSSSVLSISSLQPSPTAFSNPFTATSIFSDASKMASSNVSTITKVLPMSSVIPISSVITSSYLTVSSTILTSNITNVSGIISTWAALTSSDFTILSAIPSSSDRKVSSSTPSSSVLDISGAVPSSSVVDSSSNIPSSRGFTVSSILKVSSVIPISKVSADSSATATASFLIDSSVIETSVIMSVSNIVELSSILSVPSLLPTSSLLSVPSIIPTSSVLSISSIVHSSRISSSSIIATTASALQPVSSMIPTTAAPDAHPKLQVPIDYLEVYVGRYFELKIPERTFNDTEDGSTSSLNLSISLVYGKRFQSDSWLMFDPATQTLYGLPLMRDLESGENKQVLEKFILTAADSKGQIAKDVISIAYEYDKDISHDITLVLDGDFAKFQEDRNDLIRVAQRIAKFYGDKGLNLITFSEIANGSVIVSWGNNSLFGKTCHREEIQHMFDQIAENNTVTDSFSRLFSGIVPVSAYLEFKGVCILPRTTTLLPSKPPLASEEEEKFWLTIGLPALIVILIIIIVALLLLVCCRHKRPSKELSHSDKPAFLEDRRPIIFPEELEMVDPSLKPKKPLILPSDYLVETPPAVPPHGRSDPPSYQVPVFDDEMFENPHAPPLPGVAETATDPPPYRLPPPYFNPHRALNSVNT